jgi:hypothetical protein
MKLIYAPAPARGSSYRARAKSQGQALAEFLAVAAALVPLFLLIPMIAKYQDISHSTQMASRYVAFDAMARNEAMSSPKPEAQLADEVRRRFFSNSDAPIKTNDTAGDFKANQNLFWRDPDDQALIRNFNTDVAVSFGTGNSPIHSGGFSAASDGVPFPISGQFGLAASGIYTANVSVTLANLPSGLKNYEPFDKINLKLTRSTSLVIDPWTAKDPAQVEARISDATIFPAGKLASAAATAAPLVPVIEVGRISAPKLGQLEFWRDVVPDDRLK